MWRGLGVLAITVVALTAFAIAALEIAARTLEAPPLAAANERSTVVLDRHDRLLRAFTNSEGRWRLPAEAGEVEPKYLAMLLAFEDHRFYRHHGIDALAMTRAALQLVRHGHVVSGASTLTMQVARLLDGGNDRSLATKLHQMVRARQLELRLSKAQILALYLELAPFGGNVEGVRAASLAYFGKEPRRLSPGEAALLVALPQSPEARRPDRSAATLARARNRVLDRAAEAGVVSQAEAAHAKAEKIASLRRAFPKLAPHLAEAEVARAPAVSEHRLTLDRDLQAGVEKLLSERTPLLGSRISAAMLIADHRTGEVLAYAGSSDYLDASRGGAIDMVEAVRSPGSALKPFIYGLAFEAGLAHPETLIDDRPTRFGAYRPENFDDSFRGTVTIREALAHSLNVPAVKVLDAVGPGALVERLESVGVTPELPALAEPSLAIALGGVGVRLVDLATLYSALARGGEPVTLTWRRDETAEGLATGPLPLVGRARVGGIPTADDLKSPPPSLPRKGGIASRERLRLLSPEAAWYVTDILRGAPPPPNALGGRIAYKTGTSYGFRDAWAVGYDGQYTVAVWVGRPDAGPTPGLLGRTAAAPLLFDAFARLGPVRVPFAPAPSTVIRASTAALPPPLRRFGSDRGAMSAGPYLDPPVSIAFPFDQSEIEGGDGTEPIMLKAEGGAMPLTWLADGAPIGSDATRRELAWTPAGRGFVKLSVVDAKGRVDGVTVRLR